MWFMCPLDYWFHWKRKYGFFLLHKWVFKSFLVIKTWFQIFMVIQFDSRNGIMFFSPLKIVCKCFMILVWFWILFFLGGVVWSLFAIFNYPSLIQEMVKENSGLFLDCKFSSFQVDRFLMGFWLSLVKCSQTTLTTYIEVC
jgi:hypothetical protein